MLNKNPMQRLTLALMLVVCLGGCGCGGGLTQQDMMRNAIRRSKDEEPATSAPATPPSGQPAASSGAATATASNNQPIDVRTVPGQNNGTAAASSTTDAKPTAGEKTLEIAARPSPDDLDELQKRQRSIDNLQKLAQAVKLYVQKHNVFPSVSIDHSSGRSLLSWRVELLPYLGYQSLYERFDLERPWDSAENRPLLEAIPPEFQSPERFDTKTNYLAVVASSTIFAKGRPTAVRKVEDGVENTLILAEVDDDRSVAWTEPADHNVNFTDLTAGLGSLRGGHFFAIWGDGTVSQIAVDRAARHMKAALSIDGGEAFTADLISQPPVAKPEAQPTAVATAQGMSPTQPAEANAASTAGPRHGTASSTTADPTNIERPRATALETRYPVPDTDAYRKAMDSLRDLYRKDYDEAKLPDDKTELARRIQKRAADFRANPTDRYAALDLARKIAIDAADIDTALSIADTMAKEFVVDEATLKASVLESTLGTALSEKENETVHNEANRLIEQALVDDQYDMAERLLPIAISAARRSRDGQAITRAAKFKQRISAARDAAIEADFAAETLAINPRDPDANTAIGCYYCFVKSRWGEGVIFLARGGDGRLAEVADVELAGPVTPAEMIDLADLWWELAEARSKFKQPIRQRAVYWYKRALPDLPPGVDKVKAEFRSSRHQANTRHPATARR